jgi:DNA-binding response OmpR family regulator
MSDPTNPILDLQVKARRAAHFTYPGRTVARVILIDESGKKVFDMMIPPLPPELESASEVESSRPAIRSPVAGWDFSVHIPRFDGRDIHIQGRKLQVLRVLAEGEGPVPVETIRNTVWDRYTGSDDVVRWTIGELRKALKKEFPEFEGEIITTTGNGYELGVR